MLFQHVWVLMLCAVGARGSKFTSYTDKNCAKLNDKEHMDIDRSGNPYTRKFRPYHSGLEREAARGPCLSIETGTSSIQVTSLQLHCVIHIYDSLKRCQKKQPQLTIGIAGDRCYNGKDLKHTGSVFSMKGFHVFQADCSGPPLYDADKSPPAHEHADEHQAQGQGSSGSGSADDPDPPEYDGRIAAS